MPDLYDPEKYKEITLEEFIAAIEKNGWEKIQGAYVNRSSDGVLRACAFGQAAMNLGVNYASLDLAVSAVSGPLRDMIIELNDTSDLSVREIGYAVRQKYAKTFLKRKLRASKQNYDHLSKT